MTINRSNKMCECGHFKEEHELGELHGCWACKRCNDFMGSRNFCDIHNKHFEKIEDRSEHFEHEHADPFGCPQCYGISIMEVVK